MGNSDDRIHLEDLRIDQVREGLGHHSPAGCHTVVLRNHLVMDGGPLEGRSGAVGSVGDRHGRETVDLDIRPHTGYVDADRTYQEADHCRKSLHLGYNLDVALAVEDKMDNLQAYLARRKACLDRLVDHRIAVVVLIVVRMDARAGVAEVVGWAEFVSGDLAHRKTLVGMDRSRRYTHLLSCYCRHLAGMMSAVLSQYNQPMCCLSMCIHSFVVMTIAIALAAAQDFLVSVITHVSMATQDTTQDATKSSRGVP